MSPRNIPHIIRTISEVWVRVGTNRTAVVGPFSVCIPRKDVDQALLNLVGHSSKRHVVARASWALDGEFRTVILMETLQTFDQKCRGGQPDGPPPIRVPPEPIFKSETMQGNAGTLTIEDLESPGQYCTINSSPFTCMK
jgi:hypothetical protein